MKTRVVNVREGGEFVYIGRAMPAYGLAASIWANPYKLGPGVGRTEVLAKYRAYLMGRPDLLARLPELRGKVLGCWCAPFECHGDILAELADGEPAE